MSTNLFISWSGKLSQSVAAAIHEWIPSVIQNVEPFLSSEDIDKGARWSDHIATKLEECGFGIIVLTAGNREAPWIMFESGALSKMVGKANVAPVLVDIAIAQVRPPLNQFMATRIEEDDFLKLVKSINNAGETQIKDDVLEKTFRAMWPQLKEAMSKAIGNVEEDKPEETAEQPVDLAALGLSVGDLIKTVQSLRDDVRGSGSADVRGMLKELMFEMRRARRSPSTIAPAALEDLEFIYSALERAKNLSKNGRVSLSKSVSDEVVQKAEKLVRYLADRAKRSLFHSDGGVFLDD